MRVFTLRYFTCACGGWGITYSFNVDQSSPCRVHSDGPLLHNSWSRCRLKCQRDAPQTGSGRRGPPWGDGQVGGTSVMSVTGAPSWHGEASGSRAAACDIASPCPPGLLPRQWSTCLAVTLLPEPTWTRTQSRPWNPPRHQGRCLWGPGLLAPWTPYSTCITLPRSPWDRILQSLFLRPCKNKVSLFRLHNQLVI